MILDKLILQLLFDTSEVEKGKDQTKKINAELQRDLNATDKVAAKVGGSFNNLIRTATAYFAGVVSIGAFVEGITSAIHYADRLGELSDAFGINIEKLSIWSDAVKIGGGSAESFQGTIKTLSASLSAFATKGKSLVAPFFKELNIQMLDAKGKARDVFDILPELATRFEKLGKQESFGIGQKLGLDEGTIMLLQRGRLAVDELIKKQKELGYVTKEDGELAGNLKDAWDYAGFAMRYLFIQLNREILPILTNIADAFKNTALFFKKYSGLMEGVFVLLTVAAAAFGAVMIAANFPVILLTALILALGAAFVLAYDDIKAFLNGSDSLIGQAIQKWPVLGGIVKFIGAVIKDTWELLKLLGNSVINQWQAIIGFFKASMGFILNIVEKISNAYAKAKSFLGFADQEKELNISMAKQSLITANAFPGAMGASGALNRFNNKNLSVSTGPITIQTQASDADGISNAIGQSLNTQLRQAVNNFDDGVMI